MYGCVRGSTSGFTRRLMRAVAPASTAADDSISSSRSLSTLKHITPTSSARNISARDLPTPENTTFAGSTPAASTRSSSPPDTMSKPQPALRNTCSTARLEFAFIA